ncbi:MAG: GNAT family N-acetyltransferase [Verrucomicrobiota bacterium]|nr:GNAT family N-acetyltransferase [Verrucomicrobiota bacterium]
MTAETAAVGAKVLETERLVLRRLTLADAGLMLELLNDPSFIRNVADRNVRTLEEAENYLTTKMLPVYEQHGFGFYRVELKATGEPIGTCGLAKRENIDDIDIGYGLLERFAGTGYATEAARGVLEYARHVLGLQRVVGFTSPANHASIHVLEKLGLRYEKMLQLPGFNAPSMVFA